MIDNEIRLQYSVPSRTEAKLTWAKNQAKIRIFGVLVLLKNKADMVQVLKSIFTFSGIKF